VGAVKKVLAGGRYVSNALAENLAASLSVNQKAPQEKLSDREFQVLRSLPRQNDHGYCPRIVLKLKTISTIALESSKKWA